MNEHLIFQYGRSYEELLVESNEELNEHYNGLCKECSLILVVGDGVNHVMVNIFSKNWTSGNHDIDGLIQRTQLRAKNCKEVLEWIEYDRFEDVEYLAKGRFG